MPSDDVIVVAYGTAKKESFTGSVAVVKGEELEHRKVSNVTKALDGLAPGVQVTSGSGQPGSGHDARHPRLRLDQRFIDAALRRGRHSLRRSHLGHQPRRHRQHQHPERRFGRPVLYGARGANGVVLINTKKGNRNETNVELKINVGVSSRAIPRYETVGARDFMEIMYSAFYNDYGSSRRADGIGLERIFGSNEMYNPYDVPLAQLFTADGKVRDDAKRCGTKTGSMK